MASLRRTEEWWRAWVSRCTYQGEWRDEVIRSLITLKALTYAPTGGIVAAPTTSLPEDLGGVRNWDYRYCWVRDATLTLDTLIDTLAPMLGLPNTGNTRYFVVVSALAYTHQTRREFVESIKGHG